MCRILIIIKSTSIIESFWMILFSFGNHTHFDHGSFLRRWISRCSSQSLRTWKASGTIINITIKVSCTVVTGLNMMSKYVYIVYNYTYIYIFIYLFIEVVRPWCVLYMFTSKCASHHNGVHFFDISTSKSAPRPRCFAPFQLEMCFAPQRRAIFHLSSGQLAPHAALASILFDPPEAQIIGKTQCFATFLPFRASASSFFWPFLFHSPLF